MADYRKRLSDMTPQEMQDQGISPAASGYGSLFGNRKEKPISVQMAESGIGMTPVGTAMEVGDELSSDDPSWTNIALSVGPDLLGPMGAAADPILKAIKGSKFKTKRGSIYTVEDQARTTRERAPDTPNGDFVKQPTSGKTIFMSYEDMNRFGPLFQKGEPELYKFLPSGEGKAQLVFNKDYGPYKAGDPVPNTEVSYTLEPELGLNPVEIWDSVNSRKNAIHFGNEIIEVESNIPKVSRGTGSIDTTKGSIEAAGLTDEAIEAWRESNATSPEFRKALKGRNEELMDLAAGVKEGRVFNTTYRKRADELRPIRKVTDVPKPASVQQTVSALDKGKRTSPIVGLNYDIPDGDVITARLDIPAYVDYDTWIPTLRHNGKTMYKPALRMKNVQFIQPEGREVGMALDVAVGPKRLEEQFGLADKKAKAKGNKSPFAVMQGEYVKSTDEEAYEYATSIFDSDEWTQAGYDPTKRGFFYDRETGEAILSGDEVVQVGHLVLVKNAKKTNPEVFGFNEGGMAMNEQMDAVFKSSRTGYAEGGEVGAAPDTTIGVDPVSGNEVPMGATPEEVRDDIPAQLSEGEYVVPADVVRFYGVRFFEELRTGAKQGYEEMNQNGRIGGEPVEPEGMEMIEPEDDLPFDISELSVVDEETGMYVGGLAGYADGGDTAPLVTNPFSPTGGTGGFEIKEYVNDAGEVMYIQFMDGKPMTFIPQGFRPKASASEQAATGAGVAATAAPTASAGTTAGYNSDSQDSMDVPETKGKTARESWTDASLEEITKDAAKLGYNNGLISTAVGLVGGPLGIATNIGMGSASRSKAYDMLDGIAYQIETLNKEPDANASKIAKLVEQQGVIQKYLEPSSKKESPATSLLKGSGIFGKQTSMYENLSDFGGDDGSPDGRVTFADTWLGDLLGFDGKAGIQATDDKGELLTLGRSLAGDRRKGAEEYEGSVEAAKKRKLAEQEAAKDKKPSGSGNAALDYLMKDGTNPSKSEQARLNSLAAAARNNPTEENKQAAINAGLGWMFEK